MRAEYKLENCRNLVEAMVITAIEDYRNICRSGHLSDPFTLSVGALSGHRANRSKVKCAMHQNVSAKDLLSFLAGEYLDRVLSLANIPICGDRIRAELVKFYHLHN